MTKIHTKSNRILFVTSGLPYPPHSGARQHDFHLIKEVSKYYSVSLLSLLETESERRFIENLRPYCDSIDVVTASPRSFRENVQGALRCVREHRPFATHPYFYPEMAEKIRQLLTTQRIDVLQIEQSFLAPYRDVLPANAACKTILSLHNLGSLQYRRMLRMTTSVREKLLFFLKWLLMRNWEARYAQRFDHILMVSGYEAQLLRKLIKPHLPITVIENGVDVRAHQILSLPHKSNSLIFTGIMGYEPNEDAVLWFCREILPLVRQTIPGVMLLIVGHAPSPKVQKLAKHPDIVVTGYVPDIAPYYQQAQISIVPLRAGGGTRLKILEAMMLGRPVVSTSLGCEGLHVVDRKHLHIADTAQDFAQCIIQLLSDQAECETLINNARQLVESHYDWKIIGQKLLKVYKDTESGLPLHNIG